MIHLKANGTIQQFEELSLTSHVKFDAQSSTTLRGFITEKLKHNRRVWDIVINTQSINSDAQLEFLEQFYYSSDRAISINGTDFRTVFASAGDFPVEFLEQCKLLPQVKFTLTSKAPDTSKLIGEMFFFI